MTLALVPRVAPQASGALTKAGTWAASEAEARYIEQLVDADEKWEALLAEGAEWLNKPVQPPGLGRSGAWGDRGSSSRGRGQGWWGPSAALLVVLAREESAGSLCLRCGTQRAPREVKRGCPLPWPGCVRMTHSCLPGALISCTHLCPCAHLPVQALWTWP